VTLSANFYKQRLQDRLAVDDRGDARAHAPTKRIATESALLAIPDDAEFVRQAYLYYLRREPDPHGLQHYSEAVLEHGRQSVVNALWDSAESRQLRDPAPSEPAANLAEDLAEDARVLAMGRPLELTELLGIAGDEAFVAALYEGALCRPVDPDGLAHQLARLSQGVSRESLTQGLALSPEARQVGRPFTWGGQPWPPASLGTRVRRALRRLLLGTEPSSLHASRAQRVNERLLHHLAQERRRLASVERAISVLTHRQDEAGRLEESFASAISEELTRVRAGQAALQAGTDDLIAAATRAAAKPPRAAVVAGDNVVACEVNGFIIGVPGEEWRLAAYHAFRGVLEPGLTRRFTASLASGMTVVDVGANVGMYTLIAARAVAPDGRVYSFEPTPRTFAILKDNIQVNGLLESGLVDCRRMAVTDRPGTARLATYRGNGGHNTLFPGGSAPEFTDVDTVTLDDALAGVPRVDVIKIDVEGAEPLVWNGMSRTIRQNPAVKVFVEFAPSHLSRAGQNPGEFLDRLAADGFRIQRVHDQNGAVADETRASLCAALSVNLMLTRAGA
jgi:FkbM family methyltransferase